MLVYKVLAFSISQMQVRLCHTELLSTADGLIFHLLVVDRAELHVQCSLGVLGSVEQKVRKCMTSK